MHRHRHGRSARTHTGAMRQQGMALELGIQVHACRETDRSRGTSQSTTTATATTCAAGCWTGMERMDPGARGRMRAPSAPSHRYGRWRRRCVEEWPGQGVGFVFAGRRRDLFGRACMHADADATARGFLDATVCNWCLVVCLCVLGPRFVDVRACPRLDMLVRVATGFAGRGGHLLCFTVWFNDIKRWNFHFMCVRIKCGGCEQTMLRILDKHRGRWAADAATSGHVIQRSTATGLRCQCNAMTRHDDDLSFRPFVIYGVDPAVS